MASNLIWPDYTGDRGRWKWVMQPVLTSATSSTAPALYAFEKNPYKMDSPFPEVSSTDSSRVTYISDVDSSVITNTVLLRTKFELGQFSIDGKIWSQDQYLRMQEYYDWPGLVAIRDHFGRVFVVRLMDFDVRPQIPSAQRPYKFEYKLMCQLWQFSESSGAAIENGVNIGKVFNGFGPGAMPVETWDAAVGAKSNTVLQHQSIPGNWEAISSASDWRDQWATHVNGWNVVDEWADRYGVVVLGVSAAFYQALVAGKDTARRTVSGIAAGLRYYLPSLLWGEVSMAIGVSPAATLTSASLPLSLYSRAFATFRSVLNEASPRIIPVARYPWNQMTSSTIGGMLSNAAVACLYVRFDGSVSLATTVANMDRFRRTAFSNGSMFAVTLSTSGVTSDGKSADEVLSAVYAEARTQAPGLAQLAFFAYEDYVTAVPTTPPMLTAYQGLYLGAETVTDELVGRL